MVTNPKSVDGAAVTTRFAEISFESFRERARDQSLSANEKIGYPEEFRAGMTPTIIADIEHKVPAFAQSGKAVLDIGMGCGELAQEVIRLTGERRQRLVGVDSPEMLALLPDAANLTKVGGRFPEVSAEARAAVPTGYDAIIIYGVVQCVFVDGNVFRFIDEALALLAPGGRMIVGDLANFSKLRRFLASDAGAAYHRDYMRTDEAPVVPPFAAPGDRMDDATILAIVNRARAAGFDAWVVPQPEALPLANRREDLVFARP